MGSAIGYSTIWWARAVGDERPRHLHRRRSQAAERRADTLSARASANESLVRVGDALEILSEEKEPYDIIFNDVDKVDYPRVLRLALPRLKSGGLFISR